MQISKENRGIFDVANKIMVQRAAIIDMGTNTFHILIVEWEGNYYKVIDKLQVPVKLGKGGFSEKRITPEAYSRGIATLIEFKSLIDSYNITNVETFGTSALRNAANAEQFRLEAENILGHPVKIITGEMEAEYIYNGVKHALPLGSDIHLIMDIGGGSVEFIIADNNRIYWKRSYELGVAKLIEEFGNEFPMKEARIRHLEEFFDKQLQTLWIKAEKCQVKTLVGASGSFESLAGIEMDMFHSTQQVFPFLHHILDLDHFEKIYLRIVSGTKEELEDMPGLPKFRVEMISTAVVMIRFVLHKLKVKKMIASDFAMKEGVLFNLMDKSVARWETLKH